MPAISPASAAAELAHVDSPLRPVFLQALRHPDALRRGHAPAHLSASAVVLDPSGEQVLLVLHRKVGLWLQPGGHVEPYDLSLAAAALREATEETGVGDLRLDPAPVDLDVHPAPCGVDEHLDVRFLLVAPGRTAPRLDVESLDVRWWPVAGLPHQRVDLAPLVTRGLARLPGASG